MSEPSTYLRFSAVGADLNRKRRYAFLLVEIDIELHQPCSVSVTRKVGKHFKRVFASNFPPRLFAGAVTEISGTGAPKRNKRNAGDLKREYHTGGISLGTFIYH